MPASDHLTAVLGRLAAVIVLSVAPAILGAQATAQAATMREASQLDVQGATAQARVIF